MFYSGSEIKSGGRGMKNEEVREVLQEQIDKYGQEYDDRGIEALKTAIKIVEQQPCEDCISRAEVLRHRHIIYDDDGIGYSAVRVDRIIELSSVTPQPKTGEWIAQDIHNCHTDFKCSECGYMHSFTHSYGKPTACYTHCPNCGANMRGENE